MRLNAFNVHKDAERGWHYHVTPGKFPYIIGGFAGPGFIAGNLCRGPEDSGWPAGERITSHVACAR